MAQNSSLSTKQQRTIAALLSEPTTTAAAKTARVARRTIVRWLAEDPNFRHALAEAEHAAVAGAARRIAHGTEVATNHLIATVTDPEADPKRKDKAANSLLSHAPRLRLLGSIEAAIEQLQRGTNDNP